MDRATTIPVFEDIVLNTGGATNAQQSSPIPIRSRTLTVTMVVTNIAPSSYCETTIMYTEDGSYWQRADAITLSTTGYTTATITGVAWLELKLAAVASGATICSQYLAFTGEE